MPKPPCGMTRLYDDFADLRDRFTEKVRKADAVIVGSYVHDGIRVGEWARRVCDGIVAFYDIDTPVTLAKLRAGHNDYLSTALIPKYDLYLSFTGGPTLKTLEKKFGSPCARALYCSFDPEIYFPEERAARWDLAYMGTYSDDRQPTVERLLVEPARREPKLKFAVVGPQYPESIVWPKNVRRINHLSPREHRKFYNSQRFTLNVTRKDMVQAGYSPSVRLFEAAACATPIISDYWKGLDELFEPESEILIAQSPEETLRFLQIPEAERRAIGARARERVLTDHTAAHRALELESYLLQLMRRELSAA
jgi:spore maturation protein CgeB